VLLGSVGAVIAGGRFIIVPLLRFIARVRLRELFTAAALLIVIATADLMTIVGLSPALGAFLAGVVLANSQFRHELESDIEPFKGMLLGLFFIAVGASVNFRLILNNPLLIAALVAGTIIIKALVLHVTGKAARLSFDQNTIFTLALSQVGEFAFVLFGFIAQLGLLSNYWVDIMMGTTAISMTVTPLLLLISERFVLPIFGTKEAIEEREPDQIQEEHPVIITGFGHFGSTIGRFLRASGVNATILDNDSDRVDLLRKMGFKVFYGDATRFDILKSAGAEEARILIAAISDPSTHYELIDRIKKHFPRLTLMLRVKGRADAYDMIDLGISDVYRESLDASIRLGVDVLIKLGHRRYSATRAGQTFLKNDEAALLKLAPHRHDEKTYIFNAREQIRLQEQILADDRNANPALNDHAWENDRYEHEQKKPES
jgi:CPA2 family monovalent cation:H+ antiporter-2